ncbi:hypothetical protein MK280_09075 [Myxococcota bacterium]|nr:hypothetical protein [Myxococcota bacterium]
MESIKKLPSLRELEELAREQGVELPGMINQDVSEGVSEETMDPDAPSESVGAEEAADGTSPPEPTRPADLQDGEADSLSRNASD